MDGWTESLERSAGWIEMYLEAVGLATSIYKGERPVSQNPLWYKSPCFNSKRKLSNDEINDILPNLLRKFRQPFAEMLSNY